MNEDRYTRRRVEKLEAALRELLGIGTGHYGMQECLDPYYNGCFTEAVKNARALLEPTESQITKGMANANK